jgi:hypothetical protein
MTAMASGCVQLPELERSFELHRPPWGVTRALRRRARTPESDHNAEELLSHRSLVRATG